MVTLDKAITRGKPVLLRNCQEHVDNIIMPLMHHRNMANEKDEEEGGWHFFLIFFFLLFLILFLFLFIFFLFFFCCLYWQATFSFEGKTSLKIH